MSHDENAPGAAISLPLWRVDRILHDEGGLLIVDKPAGLVVHGGDETISDDCVNRLRRWLEASGRSGELFVHQRLDMPTSGILFFLTDPSLNAEYAQAMVAHQIQRKYVAVVELKDTLREAELASRRMPSASRGRVNSLPKLVEQGEIDLHLVHERGRSRVVSGQTPGAKRALTHYRVMRRVGSKALIELTLSTGRPHQIRASLAHLGAPVLGDTQYGGAPFSRLLLHACSLSGGPLPRTFVAHTPFEFELALREESAIYAQPLDFEYCWNRVLDAAMMRAVLVEHTTALRLLNGEPDGLSGCSVDAYGKYVCVNPYDASWDQRAVSNLAQALIKLGFKGVYLKERVRADLRKQDAERLAPNLPVAGSAAPEQFVIDEHGMRLWIDLHDGLSTGLFVDMREARRKVRTWTQETSCVRLLNLFCYSCSFSVAAALGGARTTSVDLSARALNRGRQNFELNGLDVNAHRFFKEDALKFLSRSVRRGDSYELIVLDPPSFSTAGKNTFSVTKQYQEAARDCFLLLAAGGRLLCVTNHLKTSLPVFMKIIEAAGQEAGRSIRSLRSLSSGRDCPDHASGPFPSKAVLAQLY